MEIHVCSLWLAKRQSGQWKYTYALYGWLNGNHLRNAPLECAVKDGVCLCSSVGGGHAVEERGHQELRIPGKKRKKSNHELIMTVLLFVCSFVCLFNVDITDNSVMFLLNLHSRRGF